MSDLIRLWNLFRNDLAAAAGLVLFMVASFWAMDLVAAVIQAGY